MGTGTDSLCFVSIGGSSSTMKFTIRIYASIIAGIVVMTVLVANEYFDGRVSKQVLRKDKMAPKNTMQNDVQKPILIATDVMDHESTRTKVLGGPVPSDHYIPGFPFHTNKNILNFTTIQEVINESQNIHFRLFNKLIGKFPYVILTDIATHDNKGDSSIGVGETLLASRMKKEVIFYCSSDRCGPDAMEMARKKALHYGRDKVAVLCQGGGNMLSYEYHDLIRSYVFQAFSDFKVIVFPQSIWLRQTAEKYKAIYAKYPNVTILVRDKQSLGRALDHLPKNKHILAPDIAFQIGTVPRTFRPQYDVLWIKRSDVERSSYSYDNLNIHGMTVQTGDWISWMPIRKEKTMEKIKLASEMGFTLLQMGRVVITDRLHGHIMSTLLHIPHVLLDTSDNKLAAYHNTWTKGLEGHSILTASSPQDALNKAHQLLQKFNNTLPPL